LAGADIQSAYKGHRVGRWVIAPDERGCMADTAPSEKSDLNVLYLPDVDQVFVGVTGPDLPYNREGSKYEVNVVFQHVDKALSSPRSPWTGRIFFGFLVGGRNALLSRFKSPILDDFASSSRVELVMNGKTIVAFDIAGSAAMVAALKECAQIRGKENSTIRG